ncbi:MAG: DUF4861 domain-containing protein [Bacteroidetes bacterium]|nr:DUF4861 domain-containing protein [Bacteroidota bacterium]
MKKICTMIIAILGMATGHVQPKVDGRFTLHNPGGDAWKAKVVSIPWEGFRDRFGVTDTVSFRVVDVRTNAEVPLQLERLGSKDPIHLLLQVDIVAGGSVSFRCEPRPRKVVKAKTYGRFVPERKDDFAWENDRIAFRAYGKALESTPKENAHGLDVWVKRSREMVINERYRRGDYHRDNGDGLDYYHVGYTLGAGNMAPYFRDSVWYPGNFTRWEVLDNGPLRTSFRLHYEPVVMDGRRVASTKTISLDAGTYLNQISVQYDVEGLDTLPVVIGIITRKDPSVMYIDEQRGWASYWEPTDPKNGTTAVAVLAGVPIRARVTSQQLLLQLRIPTGRPFTYRMGACWDREGTFTSAAGWNGWLETQLSKEPVQAGAIVSYR